MPYEWFARHQGSQRAFAYRRRRGALWLRAVLAVPLAVGPMLAGLTPVGITEVAAAGTRDQVQTNHDGPDSTIFGTFQWAQTFAAGINGSLDQVNLFILKKGTPKGALTVQIKAAAFGSPAGPALASATVHVTSVSATGGWVSVPLSPPARSIANNQYAIVLSAPNTICQTFCAYGWATGGSSDPYPRGLPFESFDSGATWMYRTDIGDFAFETFVTPACDERDGEGDTEGKHRTDGDDPGHHHTTLFHMDEDNCEGTMGSTPFT